MKNKRPMLRKNSIFAKIFLSVFMIMIIQSGIFMFGISQGGVMDRLNDNAYDMFEGRVNSRANEVLSNQMLKWINVDDSVNIIDNTYTDLLEERNLTFNEAKTDNEFQKEFLTEVAPELVSLLRQNGLNGVYIILNDEDKARLPKEGESLFKAGLGIRDLDQTSGYQNNSDLLIERAPISVANTLGIALDSWWETSYEFTTDRYSDFYFKPLKAAYEYEDVEYDDLAYWSVPYTMAKGDSSKMVSYSFPLLNKDGIPYGVMGVEIATKYLESLLPNDELTTDDEGSYIIAGSMGDELVFKPNVIQGHMFKSYMLDGENIYLEPVEKSKNCYVIKTENKSEKMYCNVQYLDIYNNNAPFENERMALIGVLSEEQLLGFNQDVFALLIIIVALSLLLGIVGIYVASKIFADPITRLAIKVRKIKYKSAVHLDRLNINEIDQLIEAIEQLAQNVAENESKLSKIIQLMNLSIAAFEIDVKTQSVFLTDGLFKLLGDESDTQADSTMNMVEFKTKMDNAFESLLLREGDSVSGVYSYFKGEEEYWVKVQVTMLNEQYLGVIMDVTSEYMQRMKIEYERDHDALTGLYNRRAFQEYVDRCQRQPDLGVSAMIMMDIDNLKYINDTYGHDYGDEYIRTTASVLGRFQGKNAFLSRISGDEFLFFIHNRQSKEDILKIVDNIKNALAAAYMNLPENARYKIRLSGGVAWYPYDSRNLDDLIKYADFSMYEIKKSIKGEFAQFNIESYNKSGNVLQLGTELNRIIDNELLEYYYQPIVRLETGTVLGYEALMRTKSDIIKTPSDVLELASEHGKLYYIERLTWAKALEGYSKYADFLQPECKVFINSLPGHMLERNDFSNIYDKYEPLFKNVVVEITEYEKIDDMRLSKVNFMMTYGAEIAIDDYGTGYNGQSLLLNISPKYIKIDMGIIRNINNDVSRQSMVKSIVDFTNGRRTEIIAEGVETKEELKTLMTLGVDYVQGYLLKRPQPTIDVNELEIKALIDECKKEMENDTQTH